MTGKASIVSARSGNVARRALRLGLLTAAAFASAAPAAAATFVGTVVMTGLNNPRGVDFGPDGSLYVAEAGFLQFGGPTIDVTRMGATHTFHVGTAGSISRLSGGSQQRIVVGLPSIFSPTLPGESAGPQGIAFGADGTGYVVVGFGGNPAQRPPGSGLGHVFTFTGGPAAPFADVAAFESGPLIEDQLAFRASGDVRLGRPSSDMADGIPGADIDIEDFGVVRLKLLAEPNALPGARLETSYVHAESQAPQFNAVAAPFRARRFPVPERTNGVFRNRVDSFTALLDYRLAPALTSRTTLSYGDALIQRFGLPGLGRARIDAEDFSLEATLDWQPEGPLRAIGGVHRVEARLNQFIDITGLGIGAGTFRDLQTSFGLFGEATWRAAPPVTITAGIRYQRDSQDREGQVGPPASGLALDYDRTFDAWLPKLSLAYDLTGDLTAGALIQRAYNPGGTTINFMTRAQDGFEAETLWNYEAFARSSFAGGRGLLAANLFYNDMSNAQRPQTVRVTLPNGGSLFTTDITNAPSAESYGAEVELGWRVTDRLRMRLGAGLLRTKVRRTIPRSDPIEGKEFQRSPNVTAAAAVDWQPSRDWRLSAQLRHNGGYFSDDANRASLRIDGATLLDARAAYTSGRFTAFGYVRNAFDDFHLTFLFTPTFGVAGDPREFGAGVEARF